MTVSVRDDIIEQRAMQNAGYVSSEPAPALVVDQRPPSTVHAAYPGTTAAIPVTVETTQNIKVIVANKPTEKSLCEAYILWFPLGILGLHHFYLRRYGFGFLYFFTLGLCGLGWLIDGVRMYWLVREANKRIQQGPDQPDTVNLVDAYIVWFPLGILGLHHFYLRRPAWGIGYLFTAGLFGIGWLVDMCRMPWIVNDANKRLAYAKQHADEPRQARLCDAYIMGVTPAGLFGAHHFYLGRYYYGIFYLFTLGGAGVGWIIDWFRMYWLVQRVNNPTAQVLGHRHKYLDDAYVLAFPLGFLGLHHFYLERPRWGTLYFFTGGLFALGWLFDLCRMPCLVDQVNQQLVEDMQVAQQIRGQLGHGYAATTHNQYVVVNTEGRVLATSSSSSSASASASAAAAAAAVQPNPVPILEPPPYAGYPAAQTPLPPAYTEKDVKPTPNDYV